MACFVEYFVRRKGAYGEVIPRLPLEGATHCKLCFHRKNYSHINKHQFRMYDVHLQPITYHRTNSSARRWKQLPLKRASMLRCRRILVLGQVYRAAFFVLSSQSSFLVWVCMLPSSRSATLTQEYACIYGANGRAQGSRCDVTLGVGIRWQAVQSVHTWKTLQVLSVTV